jgi:3-oxoacyl-[acyl-carrier-protein] synthase-1
MSDRPSVRLPSYPIAAYVAANALGTSGAETLDGVARGETALRALPGFPTSTGAMSDVLPMLPAPVAGWDTRIARIAWLSVAPLAPAVTRSIRRFGAERVAIVVGSSTGGIFETERAFAVHARGGSVPEDYSLERRHSFYAVTEMLAEATGAKGPKYVISVACASSAKALGAAQRLIAADVVDAALVVGVDTACQMTLRGFAGLRILSATPCRPFDVRRDGISLGEGGASLLVEREGEGRLHLLSVGETSDAHHMTAPHPDGIGAISAMRGALQMAGLSPKDIGYVNAHGTGTPLNDQVESDALLSVVGSTIPVSSSKGLMGHLLGAAGSTEAVVTIDALTRGVLPANVGCTQRDPRVGIDLIEQPRVVRVRRALSNSFGFGGSNASVALGEPIAEGCELPPRRAIHVVGLGFWARGVPDVAAWLSGRVDAGVTEPPAALLASRTRGRASSLTRMLAEVIAQAYAADRSALSTAALVFGSAYGEMETTLELLASLQEERALLSPLRFFASVHNNAAGVLSVQTSNRSFSTSLAAGSWTAAATILEAAAWLRVHGGEVGVALADENAPRPLATRGEFPAAAMAFRLVCSEEPPKGSLGCFELPLPVSANESVEADFHGNPSTGALQLLRAAARGQFGRVSIGAGWSVNLRPPEA